MLSIHAFDMLLLLFGNVSTLDELMIQIVGTERWFLHRLSLLSRNFQYLDFPSSTVILNRSDEK